MKKMKRLLPGILLSAFVAGIATFLSNLIPNDLIGATVMALLVGMALNSLMVKYSQFNEGVNFTGKIILRLGIILMGVNMNFNEVLDVGKYSLFVMLFTMGTAFGVGNLIGRAFGLNWKLTNLLSASTAICGGSAVAAIGPVIKAKDKDVAYAISSTFIFDVLTVVVIPWIGMALGMSNMGYGLWVGTAVNDTSSVVAAGYAFSAAAGNTSVIVKLTRTLFIIPCVLIFSVINARIESRKSGIKNNQTIHIRNIFPYFILIFLVVVAARSLGFIPEVAVPVLSKSSKICMVMALSAIGLKTSYSDLRKIGFKPMILGFIIDTLVVFVSIGVQVATGRF